MNKIPSALNLGIRRGGLEIRQFARQRESVVFTLLFPVILLAIFGSVFKDTIAPGVTFSQYFVAGMIASGLVNTGFQALAITIPMERDVGGLKRLRGTPMPASSYFIGKAILIAVSMIIQIALLFGFGLLFFGVEMPTELSKWLTQGMRSVFLPDSFAAQEVAKSWETGRTFQILVLWLVIGIFFSVRKFKWDRD